MASFLPPEEIRLKCSPEIYKVAKCPDRDSSLFLSIGVSLLESLIRLKSRPNLSMSSLDSLEQLFIKASTIAASQCNNYSLEALNILIRAVRLPEQPMMQCMEKLQSIIHSNTRTTATQLNTAIRIIMHLSSNGKLDTLCTNISHHELHLREIAEALKVHIYVYFSESNPIIINSSGKGPVLSMFFDTSNLTYGIAYHKEHLNQTPCNVDSLPFFFTPNHLIQEIPRAEPTNNEELIEMLNLLGTYITSRNTDLALLKTKVDRLCQQFPELEQGNFKLLANHFAEIRNRSSGLEQGNSRPPANHFTEKRNHSPGLEQGNSRSPANQFVEKRNHSPGLEQRNSNLLANQFAGKCNHSPEQMFQTHCERSHCLYCLYEIIRLGGKLCPCSKQMSPKNCNEIKSKINNPSNPEQQTPTNHRNYRDHDRNRTPRTEDSRSPAPNSTPINHRLHEQNIPTSQYNPNHMSKNQMEQRAHSPIADVKSRDSSERGINTKQFRPYSPKPSQQAVNLNQSGFGNIPQQTSQNIPTNPSAPSIPRSSNSGFNRPNEFYSHSQPHNRQLGNEPAFACPAPNKNPEEVKDLWNQHRPNESPHPIVGSDMSASNPPPSILESIRIPVDRESSSDSSVVHNEKAGPSIFETGDIKKLTRPYNIPNIHSSDKSSNSSHSSFKANHQPNIYANPNNYQPTAVHDIQCLACNQFVSEDFLFACERNCLVCKNCCTVNCINCSSALIVCSNCSVYILDRRDIYTAPCGHQIHYKCKNKECMRCRNR